jgi:tetratricopeptide (TPR) repeat protein
VHRLATGVLLVAASALSAPPWALAQESKTDADRATARALAHEGYEAQKEGRYALAADRFERAEALVDAPTLLLGLARAQAALGKIVEANESYRRILREPLAPGAPHAFARAVEDAKREVAGVDGRLAWVTLDVKGPATPRVLLDEVAVSTAALGVPLACNPGTHGVKASAEGALSVEKSFTIGEGGKETVSLALQPQPEAPVAAAALATPATAVPPAAAPDGVRAEQAPDATSRLYDEGPPAPTRHPSSFQTTAGFTTLGVGVAGLAVGGVSGVLVLSRRASLSDACPDGRCSPQYAGQVDTYRTLANVSTAATIVGATGIAAGTILLLTAPRSTSVRVYAGALSAGIAGRF